MADVNILVIDDDPAFNKLVSNFLSRKNYTVFSVHSAESAIEALKQQRIDVVLVDYQLPGMNGLQLIEKLKKSSSDIPVLLITNYSDLRVAVNSIKLGAFDFVSKPINPDELLKVLEQAIHQKKGNSSKNTPLKSTKSLHQVEGKDEKTSQMWEHVRLVAPTRMSVLILGESGTGKEHVARTLHTLSRRNSGPFVAVDCGALSTQLASSEFFGHIKGAFTGAVQDKKGLFEEANGGTLFLDEVGNLPYEIQVALLRAIQEGVIRRLGDNKSIPVDVRLVAATNEDLSRRIAEGAFRGDLYHRMNEFELQIPPLRQRLVDLADFCHFFVEKASEEMDKEAPEISDEVMHIFQGYTWPGNLRELNNIIKRAVLLSSGGTIEKEVLPKGLWENEALVQKVEKVGDIDATSGLNLKEQASAQEKALILEALKKCKFNKTKAAEVLNIDRSTLYNKIKQYNIDS